MNKKCFAPVVAAAVLLTGCPYDHYKIEMTPKGDSLERKISVWQQSDKDRITSVADEKLAALAELYPKRISEPNAPVQTFVGSFKERTPEDVGGVGYYLHYGTPMGSAWIYSERFLGNDDLFSAVEQIQTYTDKLTDLLIGWLETELKEDHRFAKLREFAETEFRRDFKNAALLALSHGIAKMELPEFIVRIAHYLAERDYFDPEQIPAIIDAFERGNDGSRPALRLVQEFLARRMGVAEGEAIPDSLRFLDDPEAIRESLYAYIRSTGEYKEFVERERAEATTKPASKGPGTSTQEAPSTRPAEPKPEHLLGEYLEKCFLLDMEGYPDRLDVSLVVPAEPVATNGEWDEEGSKVNWSETLRDPDEVPTRLPTLCYAIWAVPNEVAQTEHFGNVVLDGKELLMYSLWYKSLSEQYAAQWDAFVQTLTPENIEEKLPAFRFSGEGPIPSTQPAETILDNFKASTQPAATQPVTTQPAEKQ